MSDTPKDTTFTYTSNGTINAGPGIVYVVNTEQPKKEGRLLRWKGDLPDSEV